MLQRERDYDQDCQDIPEDEIETRYLYIYDEDPEQRRCPKLDGGRIGNRCMQLLALVLLAGFCVVQGPPIYQIQTVTVPAQFLPVMRLAASAAIVATGSKTIPATHARGTLTIYNGSILQQLLPAGFLVATPGGIEIATDQAVVIPAADLPEPGIATVPAHAVDIGRQGNITGGAIHQADGASLVIRNLTAFTGGSGARTVHVVLDADREAAVAVAKARVETAKPSGGLQAQPCREMVQQSETHVIVQLTCQYVTYSVPAGARVLAARVEGRVVIVQVQTIVQPA